MNELIQRYLDGELSEEEARALREAIAGDPEVDAELRDWERMLSAAADTETGAPSPDFTDRVMGTAVGPGRGLRLRAPRPFGLSWGTGLAWAATLVVTFALGTMAARTGGRTITGASDGHEVGAPGAQQEAMASTVRRDQSEMRVVRLVYAPRDPTVRKVEVIGTFNEWNPRGITLQRKGNVWTAVLILPRGTYEYMFVEDDTRWVTDPLALQTRGDGFGNRNAVLDLTL